MIRRALALAVGLASCHSAVGATEPARPIAIVYSVTGVATRSGPDGAAEPVEVANRLTVGDSLTLAKASCLAIGFVSGRRFEVLGPGRVTTGEDGLTPRAAIVRELPRVPALPLLPAIARRDLPGLRSAAVRVRSEEIGDLHPREPRTAIADRAVLRFAAVPGGSRYRIEVRDGAGNLLFTATGEATEVEVPPQVLSPGTTYLWSVRTVERIGPMATGEARFTTLDRATVAARERLSALLYDGADEGVASLLAAVDLALGLTAAE